MHNGYYLFTTNAGGAAKSLVADAYYTYTNGASSQNSLTLTYSFYDWNSSQQSNVDNRLGSYSTTIRSNSNAGQSRFLFELMDYPSQGTRDNQQPFDAIVNSITFTTLSESSNGSLFLIGAVGVPMANISGTVYADNTNDGTPNGVGTNAAASNISCVDAKTNMVLATATIASNGTYTMQNVNYPTDATSNSVNMILTTGTAPAVGSILTSSSLNTGWADGFDPGANRMGTQTNAIRSYTRGYVDLTADISVHPLPTADSKIVNFTSSGVTPVQGGQYRMNVPVVGSTTYNSSNGTMLDLSGNVGLNNSTALTTANGTTNSMGFYIPTAISDGGSLIYNGSTVAVNTVYPTSSGAVTGYSNSLLYYKFSPTGTAKQYSFTYKAVDQFGFISATAATYTINLAYALPVKYTKDLSAVISNKIVNLSWTTGSEINNQAFHIQRSGDAKTWTDIGVVNSYYPSGTGAGYSYTYKDESPLYGTNYYRLNQVDKDGTSSLGNVTSVNYVNGISTALSIYPNPATDNIKVVNLPSNASNVVVYSLDGKLVKQQIVNG
ncbi:MAG: hypothetical protein DI598_19265, partial [Pseudopedobacter saltans]